MEDLHVFGEITFVKSNRIRRITVKILPEGLHVKIPHATTKTMATHFILANKNKILSRQQKIQAKKVNTTITTEKELHTLTFTIKAKYATRDDVFFNLRENMLIIEIPYEANILSDDVQQVCWNGINYFLKKEAKRVLPIHVHNLAEQYGFKYSQVKIQSAKTRWGSCSKEQNINLSFYVMLLPRHLVEYVILHELCHTREMNHGERFWKLMDEVTNGKTKQLRMEMKRFSIP